MRIKSLPIILALPALLVFSALAIFGSRQPVYQAATLSLAQEPLFLVNRIKPNFIMAVDDSGSMDFEVLLPGNDGAGWWNVGKKSFFGQDMNGNWVTGKEVTNFNTTGASSNTDWKKYAYLFPMGSSGSDGRALSDSTNDHFAFPPINDFAFARSSDYNAAYFNPLVSYTPWVNYNSTPYPQISPTAAPADPSRGTTRVNLTTDLITSGTNAEFMFMRNMSIPVGTYYWVTACYNGGVDPTNTSKDPKGTGALANYRQATAIRTVGGTEGRSRCRVSVPYFPATFYVKDVGGTAANAVAATLGYNSAAIDRTAQSPGDTNGAGSFVLAKFTIKPANFATTAQYTAAINNFANWFSYYRKRHMAARAGLTQALDGFTFINAGYFTINNMKAVTMRDMALATPRQALYSDILSLDGGGGTPTRKAVDYIGQQFQRTGSTAPITLACQKNFGMLFTDGFADPNQGVTVGNVDGALVSPFKDAVSNTMADIATKYYLTNLRPDLEQGLVPVPNQCSGSNPDKRLDCQNNPHMNLFGVTLGSRGRIYDPSQSPAQDPFASPPVWPSTFPVADPSAVDDLWHATINTRGQMLNARTPAQISNAIRQVLISVQDASIPAGRDATSGARVTSDTFYVIPSFGTKNNGTDWPGSLVAYRVQSNGTLGSLLWAVDANDAGDAATRIPAAASRNLFTTVTPGSAAAVSAQNLQASNLGATTTQQYAALGLTAADIGTYPGITPTAAVNYLRGDQSQEQTFDADGVVSSGIFRVRSSRLGDLVNSTPVIFSKNENFGYSALAGTVGTSYTTFVNNRSAGTQDTIVYVGANDGFVHGFSGSTGVEKFGYMPYGALSKVGLLLNPKYQHQYFVDGPVSVGDAQINGAWGTALVGSTGAGSQSLYALDVSNPSAMGASKVLWELNGASNADLGNVFGRPLILPVAGASGPRWVVLVGNGYNSTNEKPALLVIDLSTGATIATLRPSVTGTAANGLGNLVARADANGYATTVYGGDLDGNVWKFSLAGSDTSKWKVDLGGAPLFQAKDASGVTQPISGGFDMAAGPNGGVYLYFGTGRYIATTDNQVDSSTQVQSLYGILDTGSAITGGRSVLAPRVILSQSATVPPTRSLEQGTVNYLTQSGWYVDLRVKNGPNNGERFIGFPSVQGGQVYFTTFEPMGDACTPGGLNWLYGLDAMTGSAALSNLTIPGSSGTGSTTVCTTNCGSVQTGAGAPVGNTVTLVPEPVCIPGTMGCPLPVLCSDDPSNPNCKTKDQLSQSSLYQGCVKVISVGGKQVIQPRPCGRQSWRQLQ